MKLICVWMVVYDYAYVWMQVTLWVRAFPVLVQWRTVACAALSRERATFHVPKRFTRRCANVVNRLASRNRGECACRAICIRRVKRIRNGRACTSCSRTNMERIDFISMIIRKGLNLADSLISVVLTFIRLPLFLILLLFKKVLNTTTFQTYMQFIIVF